MRKRNHIRSILRTSSSERTWTIPKESTDPPGSYCTNRTHLHQSVVSLRVELLSKAWRYAKKWPKDVLVNVGRARTKLKRATNQAEVAPQRTGSGQKASMGDQLNTSYSSCWVSTRQFPNCISLSGRKSITIGPGPLPGCFSHL